MDRLMVLLGLATWFTGVCLMLRWRELRVMALDARRYDKGYPALYAAAVATMLIGAATWGWFLSAILNGRG